MGCRYTLKTESGNSVEFNERALDRYLRLSYSRKPKLGDIVFSDSVVNDGSGNVASLIEKLDDMKRTSDKLKEKNFIDSIENDDDNANILRRANYDYDKIGVTSLIALENVLKDDSDTTTSIDVKQYLDSVMENLRDGKYFTDRDTIENNFIAIIMNQMNPEIDTIEKVKRELYGSSSQSQKNRINLKDNLQLKWTVQSNFGSMFHAVAEDIANELNIEGEDIFLQDDEQKIISRIISSDSWVNAKKVMSIESNAHEISNAAESNIINLTSDEERALVGSAIRTVLRSFVNEGIVVDNNGRYKIAEGVKLYPEIKVESDTNIENIRTENNYRVTGIMDLVAVMGDGSVKLYDYKCGTIGSYDDYLPKGKKHKKLKTVAKQMAIYRRILANNLGVDERKISMNMFGYEFNNMQCEVNLLGLSKWKIDGYRPLGTGYNSSFQVEVESGDMSFISQKMDTVITKNQPEISYDANVLTDFINSKRKEFFGHIKTKYTEEDVDEFIEKVGYYKDDFGVYHLNNDYDIKADSLEGFKSSVLKSMNTKSNVPKEQVRNFKDKIKKVKAEKGQEYEGYKDNVSSVGAKKDYFNQLVNKYVDGRYEIMSFGSGIDDVFEEMGYIVFRDKLTDTLDFMCVTNELPYLKNRNANGTYITNGLYNMADNIDPKMLWNTVGGRNSVMAVLVMNELMSKNESMKNYKIGSILTVNRSINIGECHKNEDIMYSLSKLMEYCGYDVKKELSDIKILSSLGKIQQCATGLMTVLDDSSLKYKSQLESIEDIVKRSIEITKDNSDAIYVSYEGMSDRTKIATSLYTNLIEELQGKENKLTHFFSMSDELRSITEEQEWIRWIYEAYADASGYELHTDDEYKNASLRWRDGTVTINMLESAGYFDNKTLNVISTNCVNAMSKLRLTLADGLSGIRDQVGKLEKAKNYTRLSDRTVGFKSSIYSNLFVKTSDTFRFKDPDDPLESGTLLTEEKEFLRYVIKFLCDMRGIDEHDYRRLYVPLMKGSVYSAESCRDVYEKMKSQVKRWKENGIVSLENDKDLGISLDNTKSLFQISDFFANGDIRMTDDQRKKMITEKGISYFETDIENILIGFMFEKQRADVMRKDVLPIIRAAYTFNKYQSAYTNQKTDKTCEFIEEYARANVHRENIDPKEFQAASRYVKMARGVVSKMALAFSPVQFSYQMIQGFISNTLTSIRNDSEYSNITMEELKSGYKEAFRSMGHSFESKTKADLLNEALGINNINLKHYVESVNSNRKGVQHIFDRLAMKTVERPDFYNRMALVIAKLKSDGIYDDAIRVEDNKLYYDFYKDKRFDRIVKGDFSSDEAKRQLALYMALGNEMARDKILDRDGNEFTMPKSLKEIKPLPFFYSTSQITSLKDIGDLAYGNYDDMNKATWAQTMLGGMFMHFRTFWSAKKNQYLADGGAKIRKKYRHKVIESVDKDGNVNKVYFYYKKTADGNWSDVITTNKDEAFCPYYELVGEYQEGVLKTIFDWAKAFKNENIVSIKKLKEKEKNGTITDEERDILKYKIGNMRRVIGDVTIVGIGFLIGALMKDLLEKLKDSSDTDNISDAIIVDTFTLCVNSIDKGVEDFNFVKSLVDPFRDWNPIPVSMLLTHGKNIINCVTGDKDAYDLIMKSFASTKQVENTLSCLKPDYINDYGGVIIPDWETSQDLFEEMM